MPQAIYGYHQYNYEPDFEWTPRHVGKRPRITPLFIGVELEITGAGTSERNAVAVTTALGFPCNESYELVCSEDGSIGPGFEIISQPATMEYHAKKYKWAEGMQKAEELGYHSHDGGDCGLHFHVNRKYFEDAMDNPEEALMVLVVNNAEWLKRFSRRQYFGFCQFPQNLEKFYAYQYRTSEQPNLQRRMRELVNQSQSHGNAMNFAGNSTIEFRFCRGTLKYSTFMASMQLISMRCYAARKFRIEQVASVGFGWFKQYAKTMGYTEFLEYTKYYRD